MLNSFYLSNSVYLKFNTILECYYYIYTIFSFNLFLYLVTSSSCDYNLIIVFSFTPYRNWRSVTSCLARERFNTLEFLALYVY